MKRIKVLLLVVIILFVVVLGMYVYKSITGENLGDREKASESVTNDKEQELIGFKLDKVEVYSKTKVKDLVNIKDEDVKLVDGSEYINTKVLGEQEIEINYEYQDKKYVYKNKIEVVDTTAPLVFGSTYVSVNVGYDKDICNLVKYGDNYTKKVTCEIVGDYDLDTAGTYNLVFNLTDESNNKTETKVTLNVVKPSSSGGGSSPSTPPSKTEFSSVYEKYKNKDTEIGLDVSEFQGDIDFEKVKEAGVSFVFIRIGCEVNGGVLKEDKFYKENIRKAKEAGLKVGVYLYSIAISEEEAIKHANWVLDTLDGEKLDLPIVFDWESWGGWNAYEISFYDINNTADTFIKTVKKAGYTGMLYSSAYYLNRIWYKDSDFPIWLAYYTNNNDYEGDYQFWQLCSDGHIEGINNDVDINVMYKR